MYFPCNSGSWSCATLSAPEIDTTTDWVLFVPELRGQMEILKTY
jgi:hypothetical protein